MFFFLSNTDSVAEINPPLDGTLWPPFHDMKSTDKIARKNTLVNLHCIKKCFPVENGKRSPQETFFPARLCIVSGRSVYWLVFLSFEFHSYSGKVRAPGDCNPCFTSCNIIPAGLLTTFEPVKLVLILLRLSHSYGRPTYCHHNMGHQMRACFCCQGSQQMRFQLLNRTDKIYSVSFCSKFVTVV